MGQRLYITTQSALDEFIKTSQEADFIAIDTEFIREKTYYPQLCLMQIATPNGNVAIDPLGELDIKSLAPLFTNPKVTKVFHAGDQDRIILYAELGAVVRPVFDTQRAVMLLGLPQQMSLASIVKRFCGVNLSKGECFSDWAQRPLTEKQLSYALDDVRYLPEIYQKVVQQLGDCGRLDWLLEDLRSMEDEANYRQEPGDAYKRLKGITALRGRQLAVAREVAIWREGSAQRRNLPRKWLLSDELLVEVARREPTTIAELHTIRGLKEQLGNRQSQELVQAVDKARKQPQVEWPVREQLPNNDAGITVKVDMMTALLHYHAKQLRIASAFLTNHNELVRLAAGQRQDLEILKGWRRELLGNELLRLLDGRLSLSFSGDELRITEL